MAQTTRISFREPPSKDIVPKPNFESCVESPTTIYVVTLWVREVIKPGECVILWEANKYMIQVVEEDKDFEERACPFPEGGGGGFREVVLCCCMTSSKASRCFQHLEIGYPSLPQNYKDHL